MDQIKKVIFTLCEGPHDIAFLYRILKSTGYQKFTKKIKDFPFPVNNFLKNCIEKTNIDELNLDEVRKSPLPGDVLLKDDCLLLLFSIGGDSKKNVRKEIVQKIKNIQPPESDPDALDPLDNLILSICYFFDADEKGIAYRLNEVENEVKEFLEDNTISKYFSQNGETIIVKSINFGVYIFAANDNTGKLEDILVPMMKEKNEKEFSEAVNYLKLYNKDRLKKLKIEVKEGIIQENRNGGKMKYDSKKSQINIAGQLQNSGKANATIIKDCDYINYSKIKSSEKCREIISFFYKQIGRAHV